MNLERQRERGAPVYVETRDGVLSLVYEVAAIRLRFGRQEPQTDVRIAEPTAVHLIDDTGVQRLGIGSSVGPLLGIGAALLIGPLQWALFGRRRHRRG